MKHILSISIGALAFILAAQGSLLGKLLGNLNIQISACPEISIDTTGKSTQGGKPKTQSSNPACPNYVPPGAVHSESNDSLVSTRESESQEHLDVASSGIDNLHSSQPPTGAPASTAPIAPALPDILPADPAPTSSPAYHLSPLVAPLSSPTNKALDAENEIATPLLASSTTVRPTKCNYVGQVPSPTGVIVEGLPVPTNEPALPQAVPAVPAVWADPYWYPEAIPTQQRLDEWAWFNMEAAPTMAGQFFTEATASTVTVNIPDGAQGVFFGTRNVGAYQFAN
ncbi:hypothetical protein IWW36_003882 [Coemansia brasiliensis]|uniref:Uncharacterized protein n=1 Tax=Coemansia brasiliensis TaxID=2650707 RepID=A0A9W8I4L6_9FUNG|nr:hypothetical protein IWW36_003882 [Coemansia brasiliensis]